MTFASIPVYVVLIASAIAITFDIVQSFRK